MNLYSEKTASNHACRLSKQPAGRLPKKLRFSPAEPKYFPLPNRPGTPPATDCRATVGLGRRQPREGGKGNSRRIKSKSTRKGQMHKLYIHIEPPKRLATDISSNTPSGWNCANLTKHCSKVTRQENKRRKAKARCGGRAGR